MILVSEANGDRTVGPRTALVHQPPKRGKTPEPTSRCFKQLDLGSTLNTTVRVIKAKGGVSPPEERPRPASRPRPHRTEDSLPTGVWVTQADLGSRAAHFPRAKSWPTVT